MPDHVHHGRERPLCLAQPVAPLPLALPVAPLPLALPGHPQVDEPPRGLDGEGEEAGPPRPHQVAALAPAPQDTLSLALAQDPVIPSD